MKRIYFSPNGVEGEWHEAEDVRAFLAERFPSFPETARIYHGQVAGVCDVTPGDAAGIASLGALPGPFYVIVKPAAVAIPYIAIAMAVGSLAMSFLLKPKIPNLGKSTPGSSNNDLSDRQNEPRVHGRIEDIFGTVRSTPSLIAAPYKVFESNREIEYALMCVGRGSYEIATRADGLYDIRDDTTPIENIAAAAVKVYGPNTSPNSGSPQLAIGPAFTEPMRQVKRFTSVNGQELLAPNEGIRAAMRVEPAAQIVLSQGEQIDFTEHFSPGNTITLTWRGYVLASDAPPYDPHTYTGGDGYVFRDFSGTYTIASLTETAITLTSPGSVNTAWNTLLPTPGGLGPSAYPDGTISKTGDKWEGPYVLDVPEQTEVWVNVVAPSGLYKIDTSNVQTARDVTFQIEATPINASGATTGAAQTLQATLPGSSVDRSRRAMTLPLTLSTPGRARVRMRRVTDKLLSWDGQVQEEIQWRDVYSVAPVAAPHFGDVTTVQSRMEANKNALAVKNRKLNLLVTRKIRVRGETEPTTALSPSSRVDDIFIHACLDPRIGGRTLDELDLDSIYAAVDEAEDYFGTEDAISFNATLDKDSLSFEETAAMIAGAAFCTAYRRGSVIKLSFEKETSDSTLLFCHRNKVPGSETRTRACGSPAENDGVELEYVDPDDDSVQTFYLPEDRSATNPKKIETLGIRGRLQAYIHAHRAMNRLRYQRWATEFEGCQEADLLVLNNRILNADNTRPGTQDGHVEDQSGLVLTLSQPVTFEVGKTYTIFVQLTDGTVQAIGVTAGSDARHVVLAEAPRAPIAVDDGISADAGFHLVADDDPRQSAFLVTEKQPRERMTSTVRAVNYDARYYTHDRYYALGYVDGEGNETGSAPLIGPGAYDSDSTLAAVLAALSSLVNAHDFP